VSTVSRRAARRELEAARSFGVRRTQYRLQFESRPDIELVRLPCGVTLTVEVKSRKRLPRLIAKALAQAQAYEPAAVPAVVISELGGEALAVLPLRVFCRIAGIEPRTLREGTPYGPAG
jgi:hypothetical protein